MTGVAKQVEKTLPLASVQARFLFQPHIDGQRALNNSSMAARLRGPLERGRLIAALQALVRRHEILRTRFVTADHGKQQVMSPATIQIPSVDLRNVDATDLVPALARAQLRRPFDLSVPPLFRFVLLRLGEHEHVLHVTIHHIISDGWSLANMLRELASEYDGTRDPSATPVTQYSEYVRSEQRWLGTTEFERHLQWWRAYLSDAVPSALPAREGRDPRGSGRKYQVWLSAATTRQLTQWGSTHHASLFMVLLTALVLTLRQRAHEREHLLGLLTGFRDSQALEGALGCMTNILCLRLDSERDTIGSLLEHVRDTCLDVWEHRAVPFEHVSRVLPRQTTAPLSMMFVYQPPAERTSPFRSFSWNAIDLPDHNAAFPLTVMSTHEGDELCLSVEYDAGLYSEPEIRAFAEHLRWLTVHLPEQGESALENFSLPANPEPQTLHSWFEYIAKQRPNHLALIAGAQRVTYRELDEQSERLAGMLQSEGVRSEDYVGVLCPRSCALVVAWIGVLKAGAVVAPLDINETTSHLAARLQRAHIRWLLVDRIEPDHLTLARRAGCKLIELQSIPDRAVRRSATSDDGRHLAYLVFTSGSSGHAKAVMGTHAGMVNRMRWMWRTYPMQADERCALRSSPQFVDSIFELWGPLCSGHPLVIVAEREAHDPAALVSRLHAQRVTRVILVPSLLRSVLASLERDPTQLPQLKIWSVSGEPLPSDVVAQFHRLRPNDALLNLYGSSEVAADVTCGSLGQQSGMPVHAGEPIDGVQLHVLDSRLRPVPAYVEGDIYIQGVAVCRGYDRDPESTAARFVPSPFGPQGSRMYRMGDRGYLTSAGRLCIVGRSDRQIKRRGVRIDLDQIEAGFEEMPGVLAAAAFWKPAAEALFAVVELDAGMRPSQSNPVDCESLRLLVNDRIEQQLMNSIAAALPATALPDRLLIVERLPRLASGKLDRVRLAAIDWPAMTGSAAQDGPAPASTRLELTLIDMCEDILGRSGVGPQDRFLSMGMTSLGLQQLTHRIFERLAIRIGVADLYRSRSIRACAQLIERHTGEIAYE